MSLETWKAEFYPVEADAVSPTDAVAHSVKKWEGLRQESLERHGVEVIRGLHCGLLDKTGARFSVSSTTCALCILWDKTRCVGCPLYESRGGVPCWKLTENEIYASMAGAHSDLSPWERWSRFANPEPMISALRLAQEWEERQREAV